MNDRLLHQLFGFIFASAGLVIAITGAMFWFDPPDTPLPSWGLLLLMAGGLASILSGLGVVRGHAIARGATIGLTGLGLLAAAAGILRSIWAGNLAAAIIVLTAVMPLVLIMAVMRELGRAPER